MTLELVTGLTPLAAARWSLSHLYCRWQPNVAQRELAVENRVAVLVRVIERRPQSIRHFQNPACFERRKLSFSHDLMLNLDEHNELHGNHKQRPDKGRDTCFY